LQSLSLQDCTLKNWLELNGFAVYVDGFESAGYSSVDDLSSQDEFNARCIAEEEISMCADDVERFVKIYRTCMKVDEEPPSKVEEAPPMDGENLWRPIPKLGHAPRHVATPSVLICFPFCACVVKFILNPLIQISDYQSHQLVRF
jgi:hypothetical protein